MTFHFIIIPYVQVHFRASTMYNVCTWRYYTYKKTKCKTEKIIDKTHFYLSAQTNCALCSYCIKKWHTILFKKIKLFITEATWYQWSSSLLSCHWSQRLIHYHVLWHHFMRESDRGRVFNVSFLSLWRVLDESVIHSECITDSSKLFINSSSITFPHKMVPEHVVMNQ